jgi:hypothetical protein
MYPIDGSDTLILGRSDLNGKQIFVDRCSDQKRAVLKKALSSLNLSEHQILVRNETAAGDPHGVVGPCDLEGASRVPFGDSSTPSTVSIHSCFLVLKYLTGLVLFFFSGCAIASAVHLGKDNRHYAVDLARLMPPEVPSSRYSHMAFQFRSEFVLTNPDPLNSDMFSGFNYYNSIITGPSKDLQAFETAQIRLWGLVQELASILDQVTDVEELDALFCATQDNIRSLRSRLHRRGINVRQLVPRSVALPHFDLTILCTADEIHWLASIPLQDYHSPATVTSRDGHSNVAVRSLRPSCLYDGPRKSIFCCDVLCREGASPHYTNPLLRADTGDISQIRSGNADFFGDIFSKVVAKYDYHGNGHRLKRFSVILESLQDVPSSFPPLEREDISAAVSDILKSSDIASNLMRRFRIDLNQDGASFRPLTKSLSVRLMLRHLLFISHIVHVF